MKSINKKQLCKFLVRAKRATYAAGDLSEKISESDHSTTLRFEEGDWKYHDNYFGGEPYGGREVVFFKSVPVYIMTYYGYINKDVSGLNELYSFLQKALNLIPEDKPFRGPEKYSEGKLLYVNISNGEVDNFSGEEIISRDGKELYRAKYIGGLVDQRK